MFIKSPVYQWLLFWVISPSVWNATLADPGHQTHILSHTTLTGNYFCEVGSGYKRPRHEQNSLVLPDIIQKEAMVNSWAFFFSNGALQTTSNCKSTVLFFKCRFSWEKDIQARYRASRWPYVKCKRNLRGTLTSFGIPPGIANIPLTRVRIQGEKSQWSVNTT